MSVHPPTLRTGSSPRVRRARFGRRRAVRLLVAALLALTAAAGLLAAGSASPATAANVPGCALGDCQAGTTPGGFQYVFIDGKFHLVPATINVNGVPLPFVAACTDPVACIGPGDFCQLAGQLAGIAVGAAADPAACVAPDAAPPLDLGVVEANFEQYLRDKALPRPVLKIQPNAQSFTNLPTIFWLQNPGTFVLNVDDPLPATITAVPHYSWNYGDGTAGPDSPGRAYDPNVSPRTDPAFYVEHAYTEPGKYQVTLTVTWTGSFTIAGAAQAFPIGAVTLAANAPLVVAEAAGVLTGNS